MKKVALMTWYDNENYGTALQAFSLQSIINNYAECEIVPYKSKHPGYGMKDIVNPVLRKNLFWKIYERTFLKTQSKLFFSPEQERRKKMLNFFGKKLKIAENMDFCDLTQYVNRRYAAVVCGSDQIWNPTRYDRHFFLDYVSDEIPKIAYAPSFGVSQFSDKTICNEMKELLSRFDFLSVREKAGQQIIFDLLQKKVPVCLDPTLLQSEKFWDRLADESNIVLPEKYVYSYLLGRNKKHFKASKTIAQTLGLKLIQQPYNVSDYMNNCELVPPSGPAEFLNAIRNSEFVCTDSFHGAIFAIIFEKPFVVFRRFKNTNSGSQNSRIETLLQIVGLERRLELNASSTKKELINISFEQCRNNLNVVQRESIDYLENALRKSLYCEEC